MSESYCPLLLAAGRKPDEARCLGAGCEWYVDRVGMDRYWDGCAIPIIAYELSNIEEEIVTLPRWGGHCHE